MSLFRGTSRISDLNFFSLLSAGSTILSSMRYHSFSSHAFGTHLAEGDALADFLVYIFASFLLTVNHGNLVKLEGFFIDPKESNCYLTMNMWRMDLFTLGCMRAIKKS